MGFPTRILPARLRGSKAHGGPFLRESRILLRDDGAWSKDLKAGRAKIGPFGRGTLLLLPVLPRPVAQVQLNGLHPTLSVREISAKRTKQ